MKSHNTIHRTSCFLLPVLAAVVIGMAPTRVAAQHEAHHMVDTRRTVTVSGEGIVEVMPDMAIVRFGIATVADDPEEARRQNAEAASRAMNAVRALGIEDRYIRLETLRLQPHREWVNDERRYIESGFEAVRVVTVEIHDLDLLPTVVAEVVQQGANRLEQVTYDLEDRDDARNEALRSAVSNAREKAQLIANSLEERIGPVQSIVEQSFDFPRPMVDLRSDMMEARMEAAPEPDAYAAGQIEVRVNVQASFLLE